MGDTTEDNMETKTRRETGTRRALVPDGNGTGVGLKGRRMRGERQTDSEKGTERDRDSETERASPGMGIWSRGDRTAQFFPAEPFLGCGAFGAKSRKVPRTRGRAGPPGWDRGTGQHWAPGYPGSPGRELSLSSLAARASHHPCRPCPGKRRFLPSLVFRLPNVSKPKVNFLLRILSVFMYPWSHLRKGTDSKGTICHFRVWESHSGDAPRPRLRI